MPYRKLVFWIHMAAGLGVGGLIFSMSVTGILLAFEPQILDWTERDLRQVDIPSPRPTWVGLDAMLADTRGKFPGTTPTEVRLWSNPTASIAVNLGKEKGFAYVNPYNGKILGRDSQVRIFLKMVEEWHRWLGSRKIWKPINDAASLVFLFMVLSGLYLWWPRRWTRKGLRAAAVPSLRLKGRARDWNWHNSVGFWMAPLLLVMVLTGTLIGYRWAGDLLFVLTGNAPPPRPPEEKKTTGRNSRQKRSKAPEQRIVARDVDLPVASLDTLLLRVEGKLPVWTAITLRFPQMPGAPINAYIQEPGIWRRFARSQLTLDASTAEILRWEPYSGQNMGRRLRAWVIPLHTGRAGGLAGQFVAMLGAAAAVLLVWTGATMALGRHLNSGRIREKGNQDSVKPPPARPKGTPAPSVHSRERFHA